ncbi:MAG: sigma-70 family RNA polymerase sigma factor [Capsulimonadaceae bacterium]|nr:sigma-70 family RNA polymerase sigma factor [Capsulimonadaceae bacterium]
MAEASTTVEQSAARSSGSDVTLARRQEEFDQLIRRHHKHAYNVAYRMTGNHADAEDLTQEAFLRAFRFFGNYRRDWPFDNWLYKIMSNLFVDDLRRRPKSRVQSLDQPIETGNKSDEVYLEIPDHASNPERIVMHEELDGHIQKALNSLPKEFRMTVILADIEGLSYEEISETMHCSLGTVRSRLHRGRKLLRARIATFDPRLNVA